MSTPPYALTASDAARLIAAGQLTSAELAESCLDRIRELDPVLHAWAYLDEARALGMARGFDERRERGESAAPFHGVPLGVKDIFNTKEMPTEMGSLVWHAFTPGNDARVVETLGWYGCYPLGKTVTAEFGVHHPGPTLNPYDVTRTPGTSSSGSAVAVATGMVPVALGSQTAGSTIRPASYCGVYGFKPSFGLLPRTGMLKTTDTLDHIGLLARDIGDLVLLLDSARVSGQDYPLVHGTLDLPGNGSRGDLPWRVGLVRGPQWADAEGYAQRALEQLVDRLALLEGVTVQEVELRDEFSYIHPVHQTIYCKELSYYFRDELEQADLVSSTFREMVEQGRRTTPAEYRDALGFQARIAALLDEQFDGVDVILTLAAGGEALVGLDAVDRPDNCLIWTFCGAPSLTVPAFVGPAGLPFGAQLVARKYDDDRLLAFAQMLRSEGVVPGAPFPDSPLASGRPPSGIADRA